MRRNALIAVAMAGCLFAHSASSQIVPSKESLSKLYPGEAYSPYAERRFPSRPLWDSASTLPPVLAS